jgi:hypothetical protein
MFCFLLLIKCNIFWLPVNLEHIGEHFEVNSFQGNLIRKMLLITAFVLVSLRLVSLNRMKDIRLKCITIPIWLLNKF